MKKLMSVLLSAAMVLSLLYVPFASHAEKEKDDGVTVREVTEKEMQQMIEAQQNKQKGDIEVTDVVENVYFPQVYKARAGGIVYSGNANYHGYEAGIFTVNGETAFCMQHEKWNPPTGTGYADTPYDDENVRRVLYYGFDGTEPWPGFENDVHARVVTSFALSYYYYGDVTESDSSYNYIFNQGGLRAFLDFCESHPMPTTTLTLSKSSVEAYLSSDRTMQRTEAVTLNADYRNGITFTLPSSVTLHNTSTGVSATGTITVKGGNSFYLTAPLTVTGNWSTGALKGSMKKFQTILSVPEGNYQSLGRKGWRDPETSVSLSVKWMDMGQVKVVKQDSETNKSVPQGGGAAFTGVRYFVKNADGALADTVILKDGTGTSKQLPFGTYSVQEDPDSVPEGYLADSTVYRVTLPSTETNPLIVSVTSKEDIIRGDFSLIKFGESGPGEDEAEIKRPLKGVEFTITSKADGKKVKIVTDKDGYATTKSKDFPRGRLVYGEYRVEETKTPAGHSPAKAFDINITGDGQVVQYIVENKLILSALRIEKIDSETKKAVPLAGTKFRILDEKGKPVKMTVHYPQNEILEVFETDKTGSVILPEKLKVGKYQIEEVQAPAGYLKGKNISFEVTENMDWDAPLTVRFADAPAKGKIHIHKTDEKTGEKLKGAQFLIVAREDIVTPDGTVKHKKGDVVESVITDENGSAESRDLYLGKYTVRETAQPHGYELGLKEHHVTLEYKGQDVPLVEETLDIQNKPTEFVIKKINTEEKPVPGAVFKVWNKAMSDVNIMDNDTEDVGDNMGVFSEEDLIDSDMGVVPEYTTDEKGEIHIKYLNPGTYCVQEVKADGYVVDKKIYEITVSKDGKVNGGDEENEAVLTVVNEPTEFVIKKINTEEKPVPGAVFKVWNKAMSDVNITDNDTEDVGDNMGVFSEEDLIDSDMGVVPEYTTDEKGEIHIKYLNPGTYCVQEVKADGYVVDKKIYEITVSEYGKVSGGDKENEAVLTVVNEPTEFVIKKINTEEKPVPGAVFKVWNKAMSDVNITDNDIKDVGDNMEVFSEEDLIDSDMGVVPEYTTDEKGEIHIKYLNPGTYCVQEVKADGYVVDKKIYEITVSEYGKVSGGDKENEAVLTVSNKPNEAVLKKVEKGTEKALPGVAFKLWSKDSEDASEDGSAEKQTEEDSKPEEELITDENGEIRLGLLKPGTYCVQEIRTLPGYVLDKDIHEFTVAGDGLIEGEEQFLLELANDYTKVEISKQDITGQKELPGAELKVLDEKGGVIEEWTSTDKPHMIERLPVGKYVLREVIAPKGYKLASNVAFEVKETGEVQKVVMYDEPIPEKKVPKTGDNANPWVWAAALGVSLVVGTVTAVKKRKRS